MGNSQQGRRQKKKDDEGEKVQNCVPETDFEEIMYDFETNIYKDTSPLEEELDYSEGISLREGGIITQQKEFQIYVNNDGLELDTRKVLIVESEGNQVLALGHLSRHVTRLIM